MLYFATPSTEQVRVEMRAGRIGCIDTPHQRKKIPAGATWCADNGCFANRWEADHWWAWLNNHAGLASSCRFATAPDVVADAKATLKLAARWLEPIRAAGFPVAFVAQDGVEKLGLPWDDFDCLFMGGSTAYKLSTAAHELVAEATARSKWTHMGRVNSRRRIVTAAKAGYRSCDGTFLAFGPDKNLPKLLSWLTHLQVNPLLEVS